jgi:hypothetical protein
VLPGIAQPGRPEAIARALVHRECTGSAVFSRGCLSSMSAGGSVCVTWQCGGSTPRRVPEDGHAECQQG